MSNGLLIEEEPPIDKLKTSFLARRPAAPRILVERLWRHCVLEHDQEESFFGDEDQDLALALHATGDPVAVGIAMDFPPQTRFIAAYRLSRHTGESLTVFSVPVPVLSYPSLGLLGILLATLGSVLARRRSSRG